MTRLTITRWIIRITKKKNQREQRDRKKRSSRTKSKNDIKEGHQRGRENTNNKVIENKLKVSVIKRHLLTLSHPMSKAPLNSMELCRLVLMANNNEICFMQVLDTCSSN